MFPKRIYENGETAPTHRHFHKRSVRKMWDPSAKYFLDINGKSYRFDLEYMHNFVLPGLIVQRYSDNYTWIEEEDNQTGLSCFYHGTVNGSARSRATLSLCDGMVSSNALFIVSSVSVWAGDQVRELDARVSERFRLQGKKERARSASESRSHLFFFRALGQSSHSGVC